MDPGPLYFFNIPLSIFRTSEFFSVSFQTKACVNALIEYASQTSFSLNDKHKSRSVFFGRKGSSQACRTATNDNDIPYSVH
jgi:hypothetical protein